MISAGLALIIIGTLAYSLGAGWNVVDGLYVAVATLTTSSVLDPELTITARAELEAEKRAAESP